jgi:hypothetical protein
LIGFHQGPWGDIIDQVNSSSLTSIEFGFATKSEIPKILEANTSLHSLVLHGLKVEDGFGRLLAESLKVNFTLTRINLKGIDLGVNLLWS